MRDGRIPPIRRALRAPRLRTEGRKEGRRRKKNNRESLKKLSLYVIYIDESLRNVDFPLDRCTVWVGKRKLKKKKRNLENGYVRTRVDAWEI